MHLKGSFISLIINGKSNTMKKVDFKKLILIILMRSLWNPNLAQSIPLESTSEIWTRDFNIGNASTTSTPFMNNVTSSHEATPQAFGSWINGFLTPWFIFSNVLSALLLIVIFSYLHNISLVNECLLLHMYKDVVIILILTRFSLIVKRISSFFIKSSLTPLSMSPFVAKVISFSLSSLSLCILIILSAIGILRMYMAKTVTLDPPMPFELDDNLGTKVVRMMISGVSIGYPAILFLFEIYPKMYYDFIGTASDSAPKLSTMYSGSLMFFLIVFVITLMAEQYYKRSMAEQINNSIPKQFNYFLISNTILYGYLLFEITFKLLDSNTRWLIFELLMSLFGITTPASVIFGSEKIKSYSLKFIKESYDKIFLLNIYVTPVFLSMLIYGSLNVIYWLCEL